MVLKVIKKSMVSYLHFLLKKKQVPTPTLGLAMTAIPTYLGRLLLCSVIIQLNFYQSVMHIQVDSYHTNLNKKIKSNLQRIQNNHIFRWKQGVSSNFEQINSLPVSKRLATSIIVLLLLNFLMRTLLHSYITLIEPQAKIK